MLDNRLLFAYRDNMTQKASEPLYLSAATSFSGGDDSGIEPGLFSSVIYNGGPVFGGSVYVDIETLTIEPFVPVLADHDPSKPVGVFSNITKSGQQIKADGLLFLAEDDHAKSIYAKAKRGMNWQMSMGVFDYTFDDVPPGKQITINGRDAVGPLTVLRNGSLREGSIVALGADKTTSAQFFSQRAAPTLEKEGDTMPTQAEFDELKNQVAGLVAQLAEKDAALLAASKAQREGEVKELFAAIGREYSPEKAAPYVALSADSFAAIADDLKAHKPALPANLSASAFSAAGAVQTTAENPLIAAMRGMGIVQK